MALCHTAALNAWYRIGKVGKKIESFTKDIQGTKEAFMDFLQRLTSTGVRMIPDSEARQTIIDSLVFKKANAQCKWVIRSIKVRSTLSEEWIWDTINIETQDDDEWIGEIIFRNNFFK